MLQHEEAILCHLINYYVGPTGRLRSCKEKAETDLLSSNIAHLLESKKTNNLSQSSSEENVATTE